MTNQRKAGAVLSYLGVVINAVVAFVYVPLLLGFLTTEEYGVYELIGSLIAYLSVMDMGLSTTLNRFYVKERTVGTSEGMQNLLATSAIIYGALTAITVGLGFAFDACFDSVFGDAFTVQELRLGHQMLMLVIANCIIVLPGNWFLALINANERFVFARSLGIIKHLVQVVAVLLVLGWRSSALSVLVVQVTVNAFGVALYAIYVKTRLRVKVRLYRWDWHLVFDLFAFSFFILLNMVFDQVFWKTGQVVLGAVVGASSVAVYGIACKLITSGYMQVSTGVTSVFLPKLTAISARTDDMVEINGLFNRIGRIQAIIVWGVMVGFIALGQQFVWLWAGEGFSEVYVCVVILMAGLSISLIQNLGILILQAKNKMAFRSFVYIGLAILDVVLSIPASAVYGVTGCAVVAAVLLLLGTGPIMNFYYSRVIGVDIGGFFREVLPLAVPAVATCACAIVFDGTLGLEWSWGYFLMECLAFVIVYAAILWLFFLNGYEKGLWYNCIDKLFKRRVDA